MADPLLQEYEAFKKEPVLTDDFFAEIGTKVDIAIHYSNLSKKQ